MKAYHNIWIPVILCLVITGCSSKPIDSARDVINMLSDDSVPDVSLLVAIKNNNFEQAKEAVEDGANINVLKGRLFSESNPVLIASYAQNDDMARYLIGLGADPNYQDDEGMSLLMLAANHLDMEMAEMLIERGADIHTVDKNGQTALEYALEGKTIYFRGVSMNEENIEMMFNLLIQNGAEITVDTLAAIQNHSYGLSYYGLTKTIVQYLVETNNATGLNPVIELAIIGEYTQGMALLEHSKLSEEEAIQLMFYVAAFGREESLVELERKGFDLKLKDSFSNTLLIVSATYGNEAIVDYLLESGILLEDRNRLEVNALTAAIINYHNDILRKLLTQVEDEAFKRDDKLKYIFSAAAGVGNIEIMELYEEKVTTVDNDSLEMVLLSTALGNQVESIERLLEMGVDVNVKNDYGSPLAKACLLGRLEAIKYLLDNGANINGANNDGNPLRVACSYGEIEVVRYLIERGVDANIMEEGESSALMDAIFWGYFDIVQLLIENGANVDYRDKDRDTALISAAGKGSRHIVEYLLENGADVNSQNNDGITPLMAAVSDGYEAHVKIIMEYGADTTIVNNESKTAVDIAVHSKNKEIIELLKD